MALPPVRKTWHYQVNQSIASGGSANAACRALAFAWKNSLKGSGAWTNRSNVALAGAPTGAWTVYASCDSVTAGHDNVDRWALATNIVAGGVNFSWIALSNATSGLHLLITVSTDLQTFAVEASRVGFGSAFGGANGSITDRPLAIDSEFLISVSAWGGPATNLNTILHTLIATDGSTLNVMMRNGNVVGLYYFADVQNAPVEWLYHEHTIGFGSNETGAVRVLNSGELGYSGSGLVHAWKNDGSTFASDLRYSNFLEPVSVTAAHEAFTIANEFSARWPMIPIVVLSSAAGTSGFLGFVEDICFGLGNASTVDYDGVSPATVRRFAQFDCLVVPWNTSTPLVDGNGAEPSRTIRTGDYVFTFLEAPADTTEPTVTVTPSSGEVDRMQAFQIDIEDNLDLFRAVFVMVGFAGDMPSELVYVDAGAREGFCGRYTGQRVDMPDGSIRLKSVRRLRGWPYPLAPKWYVYPVDTAGNIG